MKSLGTKTANTAVKSFLSNSEAVAKENEALAKAHRYMAKMPM